MSTTSDRLRQIAASFEDKEYRDAFVQEHIKNQLAFQIQAMRASRNWTQGDLGHASGMAQEQISRLEDPDYGNYTLKTLRRLASAFDVALTVRFSTFSELAERVNNLSMDDLAIPCFDEDKGISIMITDHNSVDVLPEEATTATWSISQSSSSIASGSLSASTPYISIPAVAS